MLPEKIIQAVATLYMSPGSIAFKCIIQVRINEFIHLILSLSQQNTTLLCEQAGSQHYPLSYCSLWLRDMELQQSVNHQQSGTARPESQMGPCISHSGLRVTVLYLKMFKF